MAYYDQETLHKVQTLQLEILKDFSDVAKKHGIPWFLVFGSALGAERHQDMIPWDDDIDVGILRKDYNRFLQVMEEELGDKYRIVTPATAKGYTASVVHLEKKGTKFISRDVVEFDYENGFCIDLFVYDHQPDGKKDRLVQYAKGWFFGRLLFLSGSGHPNIPWEGFRKKAASVICVMVHLLLKKIGIRPAALYGKLEETAQAWNHTDTKRVVCLAPPKSWLNPMSYDDLFPLRKVPFRDMEAYVPNHDDQILTNVFGDYMTLPPEDKRMNHKPLILDFGEED